MTSNPFSVIFTEELHQLYDDIISSILGKNALSVPCLLNLGTGKGTPCINCIFDSNSDKSSNIYNGSGPIPFPYGSICPACGGLGFVPNDYFETIYMGVIWNKNKFMSMTDVNIATIDCQTLGLATDYPKIKQAKEITIDSDVAGYTGKKYQRISDPEFRGFGRESFVITSWQRAG